MRCHIRRGRFTVAIAGSACSFPDEQRTVGRSHEESGARDARRREALTVKRLDAGSWNQWASLFAGAPCARHRTERPTQRVAPARRSWGGPDSDASRLASPAAQHRPERCRLWCHFGSLFSGILCARAYSFSSDGFASACKQYGRTSHALVFQKSARPPGRARDGRDRHRD
jgi:hypothetical protein